MRYSICCALAVILGAASVHAQGDVALPTPSETPAPLDASISSPTATAAAPADLPRFNLRLHPIGLFAGIPGAEIDVGLASFISAGAGLQYFSSDTIGSNFHVYEASVSVDFFLGGNRFRSSWFLETEMAYLPLVLDSQRAYTWTFSMLAGRYLALPAGFNASLGAGVTFFSSSGAISVSPTSGMLEITESNRRVAVQPVLELMVGWAF